MTSSEKTLKSLSNKRSRTTFELTKEQKADMLEAFHLFDTKGTGKIATKELKDNNNDSPVVRASYKIALNIAIAGKPFAEGSEH
ncbi:uncharacterized protein LOC126252104 [Schistocerca nitens]|uniref:uncharacterized protein LOC126252104 n=1 Tax=Schistocerca nitens TaxID=7011 RepID=UPI002119231B|nr:uncharacterized protein LOC126252104 [Schistocerca nitens]